ncbi:hypothetical protein L2E82_04280 [Cichorium intybus]|uniref:Uncharacterized protein n=1 Tax=Cichorium intybus TaxID=13427 RepID=A0ACB9H4V9_CICIN|nr:hypothetical protein L2E82_04280 [Cichorium intybus]
MSPSGLSSSNTSGIPSSLLILDSGASHHMAPYLSSFSSLSPRSPVSVMSASAIPMSVEGVGSIVTPYISLTDVYYIPTPALNLASLSQVCESGCRVFFSYLLCCVQDIRSRRVIGICRRLGKLYVLEQLHVAYVATSSVGPLKYDDIFDCCGCKLGKLSALPFNKSVTRSVGPFDIVHYDVWGPSPVASKAGSSYYEGNLLLMPLMSCWHLMELCINIHVHTAQQNGVAERKHRHLLETARSLLLSSQSPYEMLYGKPPDYFSLRVFGCTCFVLKPHAERNKLSSKSALCLFFGYGIGQQGYRCCDPSNQKLYVSHHVTFLEDIPLYNIPVQSHDVTQSELRTIDPFSTDSGNPPHAADPPPVADPPPAIDLPPVVDPPPAAHQDPHH